MAESLGVQPPSKLVALSWSGESIQALMGELGWGALAPAEVERAAWALEDLLSRAVEAAAWMSGYSVGEEFDLRDCLDRSDPGWREALCGQRPAPGGGAEAVEVRSRLRLEVPMEMRVGARARTFDGALLLAAHQEGAAKAVSTLMDIFERLGERPELTRGPGVLDWPSAQSALPEWSWPKRGAALVVEREDGASVCARVSPAGIRALAASPIGRAFGPRSALALLGSARPLRMALAQGHMSRSYRRCALPQAREEHFPMVGWTARAAWREESEASPAEIEAALRAAGLGPRGLSQVDFAPAPGARDPAAYESVSAAQWLVAVDARLLAEKIAKSARKAPPNAGSRRRL